MSALLAAASDAEVRRNVNGLICVLGAIVAGVLLNSKGGGRNGG